MARRNSSPLTDAEKQLRELHARIEREEQQLRRIIKEAPRRRQAEKEQRNFRIKAETATVPPQPADFRILKGGGPAPSRRRARTRRQDHRVAQVKFILLCILLAALALLVWRSLPA